jgi:beta-glucosidase
MKKIILLITIPFLLFGSELRWNWKKIDLSTMKFPADFLWGVAVAEHQVSGGEHSQWAHAAKVGTVPDAGTACDSYNRMDEDIACIKELGVKAFRFSVAWDRVEPEEGIFDEAAIAHYQELCRKLHEVGITPMVTLHHFVHPMWFEKKGGFEKAANVKHFVRFAVKMFEALKSSVQFWCTINEPGPYVFQSYLRGVWPPHKTMKFHLAGKVTRNLLRAHIATYKAIKAVPGGVDAQVGFAHSITVFEPYHDYNPLEQFNCAWFNHYFHEAVTQFFKTGEFYWSAVPSVNWKVPNAKQYLDFFGINYYSHILVALGPTKFGAPAYRPGEIRTDMPYALYAEGLYRAIFSVHDLNVPVYITEMGIADAQDNRRAHMIRTYSYAISKAIADGADVRGAFYWSLLDNYEWSEGYTMKFGLYEVDFATKERKLRPSAQIFKSIVTDDLYVSSEFCSKPDVA